MKRRLRHLRRSETVDITAIGDVLPRLIEVESGKLIEAWSWWEWSEPGDMLVRP